jgi:hypothetical protein
MRIDFVLTLMVAWLLPLTSSKSYPSGILEGVTEDELKNVFNCNICSDVDYSTDIMEDDICHCGGPWLFVGAYGLSGYDAGRYGVGAFGRQSTICDETREKRSNGVIWTFDFSSFKIAPYWATLSSPLLWQMGNPLNVRVAQQPPNYENDPKLISFRKKVWSCPEPIVPTKSPSVASRNAPKVSSISSFPPIKLQPVHRPTCKPSTKVTQSHPSPKPSVWPIPGDSAEDYSYYSR